MLRALLPLVLASAVPAGDSVPPVPGATWMRYADPAEAGYDPAALAAAEADWERLDSAAFLVVDDGLVVAAWGDVARRYMCHSVRKSLLSGLIGLHVENGQLDLEATMGSLGIDDADPSLSEEEKTARVIDLLRARSGVYRLAAYEPPQNPKPPRGSHAPGTFWCYNNWDFNTLLTIFEQETGQRIFEDFERRFAAPLGMQDYRVRDGYYHYERDKSIHPAYPFRMSARDLARYGLLYLREGEWGERRVLSADWVEQSRTPYSEARGGGYGYMWWTWDDPRLGPSGAYAALGVGGQTVAVVPDHGLVVVNRTNTYLGRDVSTDAVRELIIELIEARTGDRVETPRLVPLGAHAASAAAASPADLRTYPGAYELEGEPIEVRADAGVLVLETPFMGSFGLTAVGGGVFRMEDLGMHVRLWPGSGGAPGGVELEWFSLRQVAGLLDAGEVERATERAEQVLERFPESAWAHFGLAMALAAAGEEGVARDLCATALELEPGAAEIAELAGSLGD